MLGTVYSFYSVCRSLLEEALIFNCFLLQLNEDFPVEGKWKKEKENKRSCHLRNQVSLSEMVIYLFID